MGKAREENAWACLGLGEARVGSKSLRAIYQEVSEKTPPPHCTCEIFHGQCCSVTLVSASISSSSVGRKW